MKGKYTKDWLRVPRHDDAYPDLPLDVRIEVAKRDYDFADLMLRSFVTPGLLQLKHRAKDVLRKADWQ